MADVDGQIVLGLNISETAARINSDLEKVLSNIGTKEIVLSAKIENLDSNKMTSQLKNVASRLSQDFNGTLNVIDLVNGGMSNLSRMLQGAGFNKSSISTVTQDLQKMSLQISKITTTMSQNGNIQLRITGRDELQRVVTILRQYDAETGKIVNTSKSFVQSFVDSSNAAKEAATAQMTLMKSSTLSSNIATWMNQNTKAAQAYGDKLRELQSILATTKDPKMLTKARVEFTKIKAEAKAAGLVTSQFAQSIKNTALQVLGLSSAVMVVRKIISVIKDGIDTVVELDTALVDLKKTTTMSGSDLVSFYEEANDAAKKLGVTTKDIIQSASDWSRLGFSDKKSAETMAKLAAQFSAISPGVDMDTATTGLISVIKAYGIEVEDVLDGVMSKINIVGNTAATSNQDIVTGLQNSAAAMAAMNSSLEENIALFTAAQEITQDASKVGKAYCPNIWQHMV